MSLTIGTAPFGRAGGRFDFEPPEHIVYVEDFPRRVRAVKDGHTVVDSDHTVLVHESDRLPHCAFPSGDVRADLLATDAVRPEPAAPDHVHVDWGAVDAWYEEDEQVFIHVRDPYHRIDVVPTSRHVRVSLGGVELADSTGVRGLYETGLPVRWYIPREDVHTEHLEASDTVTHCPYKGTPVHWSAKVPGGPAADVAWSYEGDVQREAQDVQGYVAFYNERVDLEVDGVRQERPATPWAR
jgi:uncharacterized protein (DUF427 family)